MTDLPERPEDPISHKKATRVMIDPPMEICLQEDGHNDWDDWWWDVEPDPTGSGGKVQIYVRADTASEYKWQRDRLLSFIRDSLCDLAEALPHVPAPSAHPIELQRLLLIAECEGGDDTAGGC